MAQQTLGALPRQPLRDQALTALRDAITLGSIPHGTHLVEVQLSEDLGISRGTLREALRQLQQEGLVVVDPKGRTRVLELTPKLIKDTFEVRLALETTAAQLVSRRPDRAAILDRLRQCILHLEESEQGTLAENVDADLDFHRTLCQSSGNGVLVHQWETLAAVVRMSILLAGPRYARANMSAERHSQLLTAIETGGYAHIQRELQRHMDRALETILGSVSSQLGDVRADGKSHHPRGKLGGTPLPA